MNSDFDILEVTTIGSLSALSAFYLGHGANAYLNGDGEETNISFCAGMIFGGLALFWSSSKRERVIVAKLIAGGTAAFFGYEIMTGYYGALGKRS